ncbi:MAG: cation-transporting P-type ATPase [Promethearchaeia archaeon]
MINKSSKKISNYYNKSLDQLLLEFNTDPKKGLDPKQVNKRIEKYGYNELPEVKRNLWRIYLAPIFNFLILILIIAGIAIIILGSPSETIITFTVVFINSSTAIIQQYRAQKALDSLKKISALNSTVIRDNEQKEIPSRDIVPGDIVLLDQGSKIPADGRIFNSSDLSVNEAPLTGESEPIEKNEEIPEREDIPIQDQKNMVFMGTYIHTGRAKVVITSTGKETKIGQISESLNQMGSIEEIPLTKKLNRLGYVLGTIVLINLTVLIIYKLTILNQEVSNALTDSILRAMNIMPINLPLLVTLVLITGVLNMAQSGVVIKNLSSIESLGRVSVICADKTGTITKNEMTVEEMWINYEDLKVTGSGYDPEGEVLKDGEKFRLNNKPTYSKFIDSMVLNNNAKLIYEDVKIKKHNIKSQAVRKALGSPTEAALLVLAEKFGVIIYDIRSNYDILIEFPFNSEIKRMTTICKRNSNESKIYAFSKGAPEIILNLSRFIEIEGEKQILDNMMKSDIIKKIEKKGNMGYRNLAIAYKNIDFDDDIHMKKREEVEQDLILLGVISIIDPPRDGVKGAVEDCKSANIKVTMITGDHPSTAKTVASEVGIFNPGDIVIEGNEMKNIDELDFEKITVFARVQPSDKEIIVNNYQKKKKVVAMTGDGVNDSLALKLANCGIAMGITGTDVAKDVSDMVISDDNFISIRKGIEVGRGLFSRIRTIIYFFICLNLMEGLIFFAYEFSPFFDLFISNWQHIYIFGIVHSLPSLALVVDTYPKDIMKEPPRNDEGILNKNMWKMLILQAFLIGIGLILVLQITLAGGFPLNKYNLNPNLSYITSFTPKQLIDQKARTMFITTLYIAETTFIWTFRRPNKQLIKSIKEEFSLKLFLVVLFTLLIHILLVLFSYPVNNVINNILGLNFQLNFLFLSFTDWLMCILFASPGIIGIEMYKYYFHKKGNFF